MPAAEGSYLGIGMQSGVGVTQTDNADFDYLLLRRGGIGVQNNWLPLGPEIGGGAVERSVIKSGAVARGAIQFTPRSNTLGWFLYGMTGDVSGVVSPFTFDLGTDQFAAPWFTLRYAPGDIIGEIFADARIDTLALNWAAPGFVQGTASFLGKKIETLEDVSVDPPSVTWGIGTDALVDASAPLVTPTSTIELPGAVANCISGSITMQSIIPLDQQYGFNTYFPAGLDIVHRVFTMNMQVKIADKDLYQQIMYAPTGEDWAPEILRDSVVTIELMDEGGTEGLVVAGDASDNILWSADVLDVIAQRILVLNVTGTFIAAPGGASPISLELTNSRGAGYVP